MERGEAESGERGAKGLSITVMVDNELIDCRSNRTQPPQTLDKLSNGKSRYKGAFWFGCHVRAHSLPNYELKILEYHSFKKLKIKS